MGNGNSIGDLFFPDNPNRRDRAQQLHDDTQSYCTEFQQMKQRKEDITNRIAAKLADLLRRLGYNTMQDLDNKIQQVLTGPELANFQRLISQLNKAITFENDVFTLMSIVGAAGGIIALGAVALTIVTGPVALGALALMGEVLAIVAAILVVFSIIEAAIARDELRDAINELFPQRIKARQAEEQMRVILNWVSSIEIWLNSGSIDTNTLASLLKGTLQHDYDVWTAQHTYDVLHQFDVSRGSWTNEDPSFNPGQIKMRLTRNNFSVKETVEDPSKNIIPGVNVTYTKDGGQQVQQLWSMQDQMADHSCCIVTGNTFYHLTGTSTEKITNPSQLKDGASFTATEVDAMMNPISGRSFNFKIDHIAPVTA